MQIYKKKEEGKTSINITIREKINQALEKNYDKSG